MDVAKLIADFGLPALSRETGIPTTTLFRWSQKGRIAGRPADQAARAQQLAQAADRLRSQGATKRSHKPAEQRAA